MNLKVLLIAIPLVINSAFGQAQLNKIEFGEYDEQMFGYLTDINDQGNRIAATQLIYSDFDTVSLGIIIYEDKNGTWEQTGQDIIISNIEKWFGHSISLSGDGNTIAVGLSYMDIKKENDGKVIIYKFIDTTWQKCDNEIIGERSNGNFGFSVDLSYNGNILCVGAPAIMEGRNHFGNVLIYEFSNNIWQQKGNTLEGDSKMRGFGYNVAISKMVVT